MMNQSVLFFMSFSAYAMVSASFGTLHAASLQNNRDLSPYVSPEQIAIDPVLLQADKLDDATINTLLNNTAPTPVTLPNAFDKPSPLEDLYSQRLREPIEQFGYTLLPKTNKATTGGAVQDDYILESGDEVNILIRGARSLNLDTRILEDGTLVVEDLPPVMAAGKTIRAVRDELRAFVSDLYNTDIFLSVGKTRQINVLVTGHVETPSQVTLTTFSTIMDALSAVGGIQKTGSLRQIKIMRGDKSTIVDLYGVLLYGSGTTDVSLRDGDRILVPPIGPTLAVAGSAKRPAIYEILPANRSLWKNQGGRSQKLSLDDALDMAGGAILPSRTRTIRLSVENKSSDSVSEITRDSGRILGDGDIVLINQTSQAVQSGTIELVGATPHAGLYALGETPMLSSLLKNKGALTPDTYPLLGVIERWNNDKLRKEWVAFSPSAIVAKEDDVNLRESDKVMLLTRDEALKGLVGKASDTPPVTGLSSDKELPDNTTASPDLLSFLGEHSVFLRGAVRASGSYPIAPETRLDDVLAVAGGASLEANIRDVEITQPRADKDARRTQINLNVTPASSITLHPGDTIRIGQTFRRVEDRHVTLTGEVKNPGVYDVMAGDTMGSLLKRAGGLTDEAYPKGAIFSRKAERAREEQRYIAQARSLELSLATALQETDSQMKPSAADIALAKDLIAELKSANALGRLTVEADPTILANQPDLDILLESGDKIYIPKRPLTVRVAGEVLSPASLQFRTGKTPRDYLSEAGGFTYNADQDRAFVIYPDGSAQPLSVSSWNYKATFIPPGSTIIVPRDPKPLGFMDGAKDLSQILANLATTAIFAEDIADDR